MDVLLCDQETHHETQMNYIMFVLFNITSMHSCLSLSSKLIRPDSMDTMESWTFMELHGPCCITPHSQLRGYNSTISVLNMFLVSFSDKECTCTVATQTPTD